MKKKETTLDTLALMMHDGFGNMDERFEQIDKKFDAVDKKFDGIDSQFERVNQRLDHQSARMGTLETDVQSILQHGVWKQQFEDLFGRVSYIERKMGIRSGK